MVAAALLQAATVRCEGSYCDGLGNLLVLNLECNELRDQGLELLAPALDGQKVIYYLSTCMHTTIYYLSTCIAYSYILPEYMHAYSLYTT